jgi:hypothetical protein
MVTKGPDEMTIGMRSNGCQRLRAARPGALFADGIARRLLLPDAGTVRRASCMVAAPALQMRR